MYSCLSIIISIVLCTCKVFLSQKVPVLPVSSLTGEEEMRLKKRRDASYAKCSELKKKLKASREAIQQIAVLTSKTENSTLLLGNNSDSRKPST